MSIVDWIEESVPGGIRSPLGQLLDVAYTIEYGARVEPSRARSTCSTCSATAARASSGSSGRRTRSTASRGGNDQIPTAARNSARRSDHVGLRAHRHPAQVRRRLHADVPAGLRRQDRPGRPRRPRAAVLDPPVVGRHLASGLQRAQGTAIRELGMGTNSKLHVQFNDRHWNALGSNGETYADTGYQNTWEVTRAQRGTSGILVDYTGGKVGASFGSGTASSRAQDFLRQLEPVLPGISSAVERSGDARLLARQPLGEGLVLLLEGRSVHEVRRRRAGAGRELPLRRRAHVDRLPGLPQRRRRDGRARGRRDPGRPQVIRRVGQL